MKDEVLENAQAYTVIYGQETNLVIEIYDMFGREPGFQRSILSMIKGCRYGIQNGVRVYAS